MLTLIVYAITRECSSCKMLLFLLVLLLFKPPPSLFLSHTLHHLLRSFFIALMLYLLLFSQFIHLCDILIFSLLFNFLPFLTKYSNLLLILLPQYFEHSKNARAKKKHRKPEPQLTKFLLIKNELQF
jgi:hypothetical protein